MDFLNIDIKKFLSVRSKGGLFKAMTNTKFSVCFTIYIFISLVEYELVLY
jgi:hypothetical protein